MPAAEMKHGPIALINEGMPAVFIANRGRQYEKVMSNIQEVRSRGGHVIAVATEGDGVVIAAAEEQPVFALAELVRDVFHLVAVR